MLENKVFVGGSGVTSSYVTAFTDLWSFILITSNEYLDTSALCV
jgi:hypothetical protein